MMTGQSSRCVRDGGQVPARARQWVLRPRNRYIGPLTSTSALPTGSATAQPCVRHGTDAARIADGAGAGQLERGLHHVSKFVLHLWGHQDQFGNTAEIRDVEETMMRGAVIAGETGTVHAEDDGKLLKADVVMTGSKARCRKVE